MPSDFWAGWIVVITVVTLIALGWLVVSVYVSADSVGVANETWDETLREGVTPAPLWWFWLILALMAVSVVYLMLYPGLGTFRGALRWSQGGQMADSLARFEERFGEERARLAEWSLDSLHADELAMTSAGNLFEVHCTACHGPEGRGQARLFPDLADDDWQWGGTDTQILETLTGGRQAVMPPWGAVLGEQGVADVGDYVLGLSAPAAGTAAAAPAAGTEAASPGAAGEEAYRTYCSACHGASGEGVEALGGPALNDDVWLYGDAPAHVRESIANGRNGQMPAFGQRLDPTQLRLLAAWLTRADD